MTDPDERIDRMLEAVDPVADLTDAAIDELYPVERLEMRIEAGSLTVQSRRARPRRIDALVGAVVMALVVALVVVAWPRSTPAEITLVHVHGVPEPSLSGTGLPSTGLTVLLSPSGLYYPSVLDRNVATASGWCVPSRVEGVLTASVPDRGVLGWNGVLELTNLGRRCAIAVTEAASTALSATGKPVGRLMPPRRLEVTAVVLGHGKSASVGVSYSGTSIYGADACRPRAATGFVLAGGAVGWPSLRFDLGRAFDVCTGEVTNFTSSELSAGSAR